MVDKKSDYTKKNFNLNDFLPSQNKGEFLDSLNTNLFNRYLTQDEFDHIVGIIGDADPNEKVSTQIKEPTTFRQDNQLQPVVSKKIGTENHFMSFEDFITRIGRTGVDTEKFDQWGDLMQFNWLPPIDIDKIVNYRDYYWNSNVNGDENAQYITIKSQKNWTAARFNQAVRSINEIATNIPVASYSAGDRRISVAGNVVDKYPKGTHIILALPDGTNQPLTVHSAQYNIASTNTDIIVEEFFTAPQGQDNVYIVHIDVPILTVRDGVTRLRGDYSKLLVAGYIVSVNTPVTQAVKVISSTYDATTDVTSVVLDTVIGAYSYVSLYPLISMMNAEKTVAVDKYASLQKALWWDNYIGSLLWYNNYEIVQGTQGETVFTQTSLTDSSAMFQTDGIDAGDKLVINPGEQGAGAYDIVEVPDENTLITSNTFFTGTNISYKVVRPFTMESITFTTAPAIANEYDLWYNPTTDVLSQWSNNQWNAVYRGIKILEDSIGSRAVDDYSNDNDWSASNNWTHKSQITEYTGMIRAQMPIIEYFPYLDMSDTSYSDKVWRYRRVGDVSYTEVQTAPRMIEIFDFAYTGTEFDILDPYTIRFNSKYGNFGAQLKAGEELKLVGFAQNDGYYTIEGTSFNQPPAGGRFVTTIKFTNPLVSTADLPLGANIQPKLTSMGDTYISYGTKHWEYGGVKDIHASSVQPIKNPMLAVNVDSYVLQDFETIVGLYSQEYSSIGGDLVDPTLVFDPTLQNIVLIDDYQEGDIRVYINGKRVYGVFEDIQSDLTPDYVAGIRFVNNFTIKSTDKIRVELGEYAEDEIGLGAVTVFTPVGTELVNLVNTRKVEQTKSEVNQYPFFALRDIYGERLSIATSIFKYKESESASVNAVLLKRIVTDGTDYSFVQELSDPDSGRLYCYYDYQSVGDELQTIWKRGTNNEKYVPTKIDGQWEMPNQWYYNIDHKNYTDVNLTQIYRHFKSIIDLQDQPGMFSRSGGLFFLDDDINCGVGGTIKEHNESFDTLVSAIFVNNGNPPRIIEFAKLQYESQIRYVKDRFYQNAAPLFRNTDATSVDTLQTAIVENILELIENNGKYDQWFGDSTSFNPVTGKGVRNWIASIPQFGLSVPVKPRLLIDSSMGIYTVIGHDGRSIDVAFSPALRMQMISRITTGTPTIKQIIANENEQFPTTYLNKPIYNGLFLVRTNTTAKTVTLYRATPSLTWEKLDPNAIFTNSILDIENRLYDVAIEKAGPLKYDFNALKTDPSYESLLEEQFNQYAFEHSIDQPLVNSDRFRQNNPFTWNYAYSAVQNDPVTGNINYNVAGTWQALYKNIFGTAYPHLEPWVLQGYATKPTWWDATYVDDTGLRKWRRLMWTNIFAGIVPNGRLAPDGTVSTGAAGKITKIFNYLPVNTSTAVTQDGFAMDAILPPYWNSVNTTDPKVRGLYDPNEREFVTTPGLDFEFGQDGLVEWEWKNSGSYLYDLMTVAYKIDPMKFLHAVFGVDYQLVSCLQISKESEKVYSHRDVIFHGDFQDDKNDIYRSFGMNQWYIHYNRYAGYDGISSEFRAMWKEWTPDLSYLVGAFIDTSSFNIHNDYFDITNKDYEIAIKKTKGISDKWLQSLSATVTSIPSQYSKLREQGIGWTASFNNVSPISRQMEYYGVQNYSVNVDSANSTFTIFNYPIKSVSYAPSRGFQTAIYSDPLALASPTGLMDGNDYDLSVTFNGTNTVTVQVEGKETVEDYIDVINEAIKQYGYVNLENGNLSVYSLDTSIDSSVDILVDDFLREIVGFSELDAASATENVFEKCFQIDGNFVSVFEDQTQIHVTNDLIFTGTYTIAKLFYDQSSMKTLIFVEEDVMLPEIGSFPITGVISPGDAITLPAEWTTGTMVYFNTTGYLPVSMDDEVPYYIIRLSDNSFKIAETQEAALKNIPMAINGVALGETYVGRLEMTFTALAGARTNYVWRTHVVDYRRVLKANNLSISGIQLMVDFLTGYAAYTNTQGFLFKNDNADNYDRATGMNNNWHTETEKFVDWLFALRNYNQEAMLSYEVRANVGSDTLEMVSGTTPNWQTGTAIVVQANPGGSLPSAFDTPFAASIPYYVVRIVNNNTEFKLAVTRSDAERGNTIDIGTASGPFRVQMYKDIVQFPSHEINPFKHYVWVEHAQGVLGNVLDEDYTDPTSASRLYDNNLLEMPVSDVLVFRKDKESRISLTGDIRDANYVRELNGQDTRHMAGMHLFFDGYEHIIHFEDYSVTNSLIYDSFFGLATPRFYVEFDRQQQFTLRPNVGGFVIQGDSLVQNFESVTNDMRHFYDAVNASEGRLATNLARQSLGYDGPKDYMTNLKINDKTQFQFWQGMIQSKGSIRAVDAFVNQTKFESAAVDEFWAYKVSEFGDANERNHIEMKLIPDDVVRNELRLEFVAPENVAPDTTFKSIQLTDMSRWWNQPDQLEDMAPNQSFFFNSKVTSIVDDVLIKLMDINGRLVYISDYEMPNIIITYQDEETQLFKTLVNNIDYRIINLYIVEFLKDPRQLRNVFMSVLTYDYNAHNPAKVIDKKDGIVTTNLPIWNPSRGQYYAPAHAVVDLQLPYDPATYTNSLDGSNTGTATWKSNHEGQVWMDSSEEQYVPYNDANVFKNINDRIALWGNLAPWGKIKLYQWTSSIMTPEEYEEKSLKDSKNLRLSNDLKVTGTPYKRLYENMNYQNPDDVDAPPYWVEVKNTHLSFFAGLSETVATQIQGKTVDLFVNGSFVDRMTFENAGAVTAYFNQMYFGNYCHVLTLQPVPTEKEIREQKYRYYTPYTVEKRFDSKSGNIYNLYYYWVTDKKNEISVGTNNTTIYSSEKSLNDMSAPYMIVEGFRTPDFGYGLIFGNIFDEYGYDLPYRYTQAIIRGLQGTVKEEDRYVVRFTRDFTLRDKLERTSMIPKNVHEEWKLFREKQFEKIDPYLWNKLIEALIGYKIKNGNQIQFGSQIPSLNRILYDRLYLADTQYGLGDQQVFTDKTLSLQTVLAVLTDPNRVFEFVNIAEFLERHDFVTPEGIVAAMNEIYQSFSVSEVNSLYFATLHDAISLKKEYAEFLKTSWVALQISENVVESVNVPFDELRLVPGEGCVVETPEPSPTPSPTPTASATPTPTATPQPTPTPTVTPSSTMGPTPSVTPTVTPSATPLPVESEWNVVIFNEVQDSGPPIEA